jgi:hypothetical protein
VGWHGMAWDGVGWDDGREVIVWMPGGEVKARGECLLKKFVFPIESWFFTFF